MTTPTPRPSASKPPPPPRPPPPPGLLVELAARILDDHGRIPTSSWSRAVAILLRQAIERSLDQLWRVRAPDMGRVSRRAQFLCLRVYLGTEPAGQAHLTWRQLSRACHHHAYELDPTDAELRDWLAQTRQLLDAIGAEITATNAP